MKNEATIAIPMQLFAVPNVSKFFLTFDQNTLSLRHYQILSDILVPSTLLPHVASQYK